MSSKNDKMMLVAECTLQIIFQHGFPAMSFARVARAANVSRAWLYKYIGKTKEDLVNFSLDVMGKGFAQLEGSRPRARDAKDWLVTREEALSKMLDDAIEHPHIIPLYFKYRPMPNALGKRLTEIEKQFLNKEILELMEIFQIDRETARKVAEILTSFRLGLAYRWHWAGMSERVDKNSLLRLTRRWLRAVVTDVVGATR